MDTNHFFVKILIIRLKGRYVRIKYGIFSHAAPALLSLGFLDNFLWSEDNFAKDIHVKISDFEIQIKNIYSYKL